MKASEPGFRLISPTDGRRGVWMRLTEDPGGGGERIELCWGREGDDGDVIFPESLVPSGVADALFFAHGLAEGHDLP